MFRQVPVLPVVVPLCAVTWGVLLLALRRSGALTPARALVGLAVCVYVAGIVANTVFPIFLDKPASTTPWTQMVDVEPLVGYEVTDLVKNVVVFVPLGALLQLLLGALSPWRILLSAAALSLGIEVTQLITNATLGGGHVADVNDLLANTLGAALGIAVLLGARQVPALRELAARCSRPTAGRPPVAR